MPIQDIYPEEVTLWDIIQNKCKVAFDIGIDDISHLVHHRRPENDVKIYLFEPSQRLIPVVRKMYQNIKNVFIYNIGFGDTNGTFNLFNNSKSIFQRTVCRDEENTSITIERLDDFCLNNGITEIDFLKIDTEGYDGRILLCGAKIIKTCKWIQIENFSIIETNQDIKQQVVNLVKTMNLFCYKMINTKIVRIEPEDLIINPEYCNYLLCKEEFIYEN